MKTKHYATIFAWGMALILLAGCGSGESNEKSAPQPPATKNAVTPPMPDINS